MGPLTTAAAGVIIGTVETVLAVAFAAFVFGGYLFSRLADGIGLYLAPPRSPSRSWRSGPVAGVSSAACRTRRWPCSRAPRVRPRRRPCPRARARASGALDYEAPDIFLTVVAEPWS